ncbi:MAG: threonylcarbamoyl-AMP synthase [Clostridia bacterium]|nr:threonylcarbamoyl-AMP synthase [Clostridia bacterium]
MECIDVKNGYTNKDINKIVKYISLGGIVILPTDTVYGIAADVDNVGAVKKIYEIKNRPITNPVNILVSNLEMIQNATKKITETEKKIIKKFFPGALTIIFEKDKKISNIITAGLDTVGIRMPNNKMLLEIIEKLRKTNSCNKL